MSFSLEINEGSSRRLSGEAVPLRWRSWPLRDRAQFSLVVVAGLAAVGLVVRWAGAQSHLALGAVGLLAITMWRYFVPIVYELNDSGLERRILGWKLYTPWRTIRRWEAGPDGLLIFRKAEVGLLDWCRAIYVPFGEHADQILARFRVEPTVPKPWSPGHRNRRATRRQALVGK